MRLNLFWKLIFLSTFILTLIALILNFTIEPLLINRFQDSKLKSADLIGDAGSVVVTNELTIGCSQKKIDQLSRDLSGSIHGTIVFTIPNCETGGLANFDRDLFRNQADLYNTLGGQSSLRIKPTDNAEKSVIEIFKPLWINQQVVGAIQIELDTKSLQAEVSPIFKLFYFYLLLVAVFSFGITYLVYYLHQRRIIKIGNLFNGVIGEPGIPDHKKASVFNDEMEELEKTIKQQVLQIQQRLDLFSSNNKISKSILANMSDGILVADQTGQVKLINQAAASFFEVEFSQAEGHSIVEVIRNHEVVEIYEKCRQSQQMQIADTEITSNHHFIRSIATPLTSELLGSVLLLFQDLTRIRQLEIVRQDFVSNVSHELRTPLAALKALVETVQESAGHDPDATEKFLERMNGEIDNLTQMVEELLELSKIESGKVPLEKQIHTPDEIISKAGERMKLQVQRAKLELIVEKNPSLPAVMVDFNRLEQVLVNLIHNSIKFTPPGGMIKLSAYHQKNSVVFSISDTGTGIPPRDLERIFERFYKVDRARTALGTGLGLSIARHLVEAHGGRIWAESTPSKGSIFFFSIPTIV